MRALKTIALIFFFNIAPLPLPAHYTFSTALANTYKMVLHMQVDSADILINQCYKNDPQNNINLLVANYIDFMKLAATEDYGMYNTLSKNQDIRLKILKNDNTNSPYKQYIMGEIYFQWAFLKLKFGREISGFWDLLKAYNLLQTNARQYPTFVYHKKSLGLLHIMLSLIPPSYKWAVKAMGYTVDLNTGISEIYEVIRSNTAISDEASLMMLWLNLLILQSDNPAKSFAPADSMARNSPYHAAKLIQAYAFKKKNKIENAINILENLPPNSGLHYTPYLYFFKAHLYLYKGEYASCKHNAELFIKKYKGITLKKSVYYHLYLADYLSGNNKKLASYRDTILKVGKTFSEFDKIAYKAMQNEQKPSLYIIKSRLLYDGGYYHQSMAELAKIHPDTLHNDREYTEYYYRHARIYQALDDTAKAIKYYEITIAKQTNKDYYFAPNAHLQIANLYKNTQPDIAMKHLENVEKYSGYEYEYSIHSESVILKNYIKQKY
ncbi:MAG: hypothetical protein NW207_04070 [Cytophagales bacterium]|nr:hypothetical protein [Cytophagales bacterium]